MANPVKGEVALDVDGVAYTLTFDFNAICAIEEVFDLPIALVGQKLSDGMRAGDLRTMFAAGLSKHQPGMTETQAGEIITVVGFQPAAEAVAAALSAAFGPAETEVASGASNPRKPSRRSA